MTTRRKRLTFGLVLFLAPSSWAFAADHLDAPVLRQPGAGGRDINDVYVFQSPTNAANTVLVMTTTPFAGIVNPFGTVSLRTFDPSVQYEFLVDNNGDAVADVAYATSFSAPVIGQQTLVTTRNGVTVAMGNSKTTLPVTGGGLLQANLFEDPFFFDLTGFNNGLQFTGADTFAGADISAIVLEVPSTALQNGANPNISVWARTLAGGNQIDRMGRPVINTVLIALANKDGFNQGQPANDPANFQAEGEAKILTLNGGNAVHAAQTADLLFPDVITFDTTNPNGFLNGRRLQDDVIDTALGAVTNGLLTTDGVNGNDKQLPGVFPYLGAANFIPEPEAIAIAAVSLVVIGIGSRWRNRLQN